MMGRRVKNIPRHTRGRGAQGQPTFPLTAQPVCRLHLADYFCRRPTCSFSFTFYIIFLPPTPSQFATSSHFHITLTHKHQSGRGRCVNGVDKRKLMKKTVLSGGGFSNREGEKKNQIIQIRLSFVAGK